MPHLRTCIHSSFAATLACVGPVIFSDKKTSGVLPTSSVTSAWPQQVHERVQTLAQAAQRFPSTADCQAQRKQARSRLDVQLGLCIAICSVWGHHCSRLDSHLRVARNARQQKVSVEVSLPPASEGKEHARVCRELSAIWGCPSQLRPSCPEKRAGGHIAPCAGTSPSESSPQPTAIDCVGEVPRERNASCT